jgi:hypothetical protein
MYIYKFVEVTTLSYNKFKIIIGTPEIKCIRINQISVTYDSYYYSQPCSGWEEFSPFQGAT